MCWVVVTPIAKPVEKAYDVQTELVAFIPMSYLIFYVFVNFPSNWVIDVKGIKKGVVIGACLTCIGCLIRCLVKVSFGFVIAGQVFCAIAQPFLTNAPMKIAVRWYMPKNVNINNVVEIISSCNIVCSQYHRHGYWVFDSFLFC
jgi:FLVCR family feline leukemia virus subgroup C receptor-related protein